MRHPHPARRRAAVLLCAATLAAAACSREDPQRAVEAILPDGPPDEYPVLLNTELPFRYPPALYDQKVQANVTLRLFIDSLGRVIPDSTLVQEASGHRQLDSAAVTGSRELRFAPARRDGRPLAVSALFPIYFRHPEAAPLPGDTVLKARGDSSQPGAPSDSSPSTPRP